MVENHGVDPDYVVDQRPDVVLEGHDPHLEKAIELAKEGLKKLPAPLHRPAYPIKALGPNPAGKAKEVAAASR